MMAVVWGALSVADGGNSVCLSLKLQTNQSTKSCMQVWVSNKGYRKQSFTTI